jgi:preprotein translocase subunit YajC
MLRFSSVIAVLASASGVFAQAGAAPAPKGGFGDPTFIFMMVAMFAIIYFLMLRPQAKKQKETQRMLNELKKGDKVLTVAGIIGIVGNVKDSSVMVKVADSTVLEFKKAAITAVLNFEDKEEKNSTNEKDYKAAK